MLARRVFSLVAAFAVAFMQNKDLEESVKYANYAASLSVTKLGAQASLPTIKIQDSEKVT